jgi:folate-binding protein YgfZ
MVSSKERLIARLDDLVAVHVNGDDAQKFLHAQFTNDLANLAVNNWQYTGYCTPKGRLIAFLMIARTGETEYLLIMPGGISEAFTRRLGMFVLRDDVTINRLDDVSISGIIGGKQDLAAAGIAVDEGPHALTASEGDYLLTVDPGNDRFLFVGKREKLQALGFTETDRNIWTLHDIRAGIPSIVADTQEAFVPQMLNLDLISAVNFKKGCYPGQEVVARVHYLGKIKQRMYLATTEAGTACRTGEKLYIAGDEENTIGTVIQSASDDSGQLVQVVLQTAAVDGGSDIRLGSADGDKLVIGEQPYSIDQTADNA